MADMPGWKIWADKQRKDLDELGKALVYPGVKADRRDGILAAAKERMKVILEIERSEEEYGKLYGRMKALKTL